ncbi:hypothetical protein DFH06DRAFT_372975 [Mycena polygramma]|nr:hypothetical protein DFH06DRAFT_372975 [Mycena polygramma]
MCVDWAIHVDALVQKFSFLLFLLRSHSARICPVILHMRIWLLDAVTKDTVALHSALKQPKQGARGHAHGNETCRDPSSSPVDNHPCTVRPSSHPRQNRFRAANKGWSYPRIRFDALSAFPATL